MPSIEKPPLDNEEIPVFYNIPVGHNCDNPLYCLIKKENHLPKEERSTYRLPVNSSRYAVIGTCRTDKNLLICLLFRQAKLNGPHSEGELTVFPISAICKYLIQVGYVSKTYVCRIATKKALDFCDSQLTDCKKKQLSDNEMPFDYISYGEELTFSAVESVFGSECMQVKKKVPKNYLELRQHLKK